MNSGPRVLLLLVTAACNAKPAAPRPAATKQATPPTVATHGSAAGNDPWAAAPGSAYDPVAFAGSDAPAWVHDPPAVLRDKINGVNAHVVVLTYQASFAEYRDVLARAEHTPGVVAAEPFIFSEDQIAKGSGAPLSVAVKAVDPARVDRVLTIGKHMVTGSLDALASGDPPPIVLGDELATKLGAKLGDHVTVTLPVENADDVDAKGAGHDKPRTEVFRVAGTFRMDFIEYDDRLALASLTAVQALVGRGDQVMGIEMTVKDVEHAGDVAKALETALGGRPYKVMDWYELNRNLFTALFGDKRP